MIPFTRRFLSKAIPSGILFRGRYASTYTLPDLPYDYSELEPFISAEIMQLHHSKHHATYVNNLNTALEKQQAAEASNDIESVIALQSAVKFNGGGACFHFGDAVLILSLSMQAMSIIVFFGRIYVHQRYCVQQFRPPEGPLATAIDQRFGSLKKFIDVFSKETAAVQGSGWGWLAYNTASKSLTIETRPNQDPLTVSGKVLVPLLGIDVWEHAYYLQYKNVRPEYLKAVWNVVHWKDVEQRYLDATN